MFDGQKDTYDTTSFVKDLIEDVLDLPWENFEKMGCAKKPKYWARDFGIDLKIEDFMYFDVEFQSTFFCFDQAYRLISYFISEACRRSGYMVSVLEIHVARDFFGIHPNEFFEKGFDSKSYVKRFKCNYRAFVNEKNEKNHYLAGKSNDWGVSIYDKTRELIEQRAKRTPFKYNYYESLGYIDKQVTRVELRINSKISRRHTHNLIMEKDEEEFCKSVFKDFYKGHRIYEIKEGEVFNEKDPKRNNIYKLWEDVFNLETQLAPRGTDELKEELLNLGNLSKPQLLKRFERALLDSDFTISDGELSTLRERTHKKRQEKKRRFLETKDKHAKLVEEFNKIEKPVASWNDVTGKIYPNRSLTSFIGVNVESDQN